MSTATLTRPTTALPPAIPPTTTASAATPGEVVVDRAQLGWALEQCARLGRNGYGLPWTSRVLITTRDRTLTVTRSNGDADLTATIPTAAGIGGTRVPALAALRGLVALLDGDDVTLTFHRHSEALGIAAGTAAYTLACIDPNSHPAGGADHPDRQLTIATPLAAATVAAVRRVLPFAATHLESRAVLTVAAIHDRQAVATDSYRLAVADLAPDTGALPPMLIPAAPLARVLRGADDGWAVTHHPGGAAPDRLELTRDQLTWRTRLLEGKFPVWTTLLPADPAADGIVTVDRAAAVRALRRLTAVAGYGVPVTLTAHGGELRIVLNRGDDGDGAETLPCTGGLAEPVAFNPRYLTAALASLAEPTATLANPGDNRPALFTEPGYRHLLMPVRL